MTVTDIKVYGFAKDSRSPDRAEVRLQMSRWGRDWEATHQAVKSGVGVVLDALKQVAVDYPTALGDPTISQISQRTWADDIGVAYSEAVDITVVFTDFYVMSEWIFRQPASLFRVMSIGWQLSPAVMNEVNIVLSVDAVRDARRKAETFATAAGLEIIGLAALSDPQLVAEKDADMGEPRPVPTNTAQQSDSSNDEVRITPTPIENEICIWAHFIAEPEPETAPMVTLPPVVPIATPPMEAEPLGPSGSFFAT